MNNDVFDSSNLVIPVIEYDQPLYGISKKYSSNPYIAKDNRDLLLKSFDLRTFYKCVMFKKNNLKFK